MVKKIVLATSCILLFLIGIIIFLWQNKLVKSFKRDYIVVSVQGEVNYLSPLTFKPALTVWQIITHFDLKANADVHNTYIKNKQFKNQATWKKIKLEIKIYEDSIFKIER